MSASVPDPISPEFRRQLNKVAEQLLARSINTKTIDEITERASRAVAQAITPQMEKSIGAVQKAVAATWDQARAADFARRLAQQMVAAEVTGELAELGEQLEDIGEANLAPLAAKSPQLRERALDLSPLEWVGVFWTVYGMAKETLENDLDGVASTTGLAVVYLVTILIIHSVAYPPKD